MSQKPSVGRIVHFHHGLEDGVLPREPTAAIITAVHGGECVSLTVFRPWEQPQHESSVLYSEDANSANDRWCWPPRV